MNASTYSTLSRQVGREVSLDLVTDQLKFRRFQGTLVELSPAVIALENDHGDDVIPVDRVSIIRVRTPYGLDLTSEQERSQARELSRVTAGLDISEDEG